MKNRILRGVGVVSLALVVAGCVPPQRLLRLSAEWRFGPEQFTNTTADPAGVGQGGAVIYTRSVDVPASERTLYVTLSTTGDGHGGAAHWFSALVNGQVCNRGNDGAGFAPDGWVPLQKHRDTGPGGDGGGGLGDLHDNSIYYTWCCNDGVRPGGANRVEIKLASSIEGEIVFVERSHYYVDSTMVQLCNEAEPVAPEALGLEAMPEGHRQEHMRRQ